MYILAQGEMGYTWNIGQSGSQVKSIERNFTHNTARSTAFGYQQAIQTFSRIGLVSNVTAVFKGPECAIGRGAFVIIVPGSRAVIVNVRINAGIGITP
jgi:hypothetical protein